MPYKFYKFLSSRYRWVIEGLLCGLGVFFFLLLLWKYVMDMPRTTENMLETLVYCLLGGLVYGLISVKWLQQYLINRHRDKRRH